MKKLLLLRHAEAANDLGADDSERPLTSKGVKQATIVGQYLQNNGYAIDHVLCSSARRTKMTLKGIQDSGAMLDKKDYLDTLYNAPAERLMNELFAATGKNVMMIAHNPGIHQLAGMLTQTGSPQHIERLMFCYTPATLSIFECPFDEWTDTAENQSALIDLFVPS